MADVEGALPKPPIKDTASSNAVEGGRLGQRPFARALALAGYLTSESLTKHIPNVGSFPQALQSEIDARLSRSLAMERLVPHHPARFIRIKEREVLDLLRQIAGAFPMALENLTGFEWVEVENLIAGRLVTGPLMPGWENLPSGMGPLDVAQFCLLSGMNGQIPMEVRSTPFPMVLCDWEVGSSLQVIRVVGRQILLRLDIQNPLDPIRVMLVDRRTIAITGLERLVTLAQHGISRALCLVSYGYGIAAIDNFPSTEPELLFGGKPPLITDLLAKDLAVSIPVRHPLTVIQLRPERVSMA